MNTYVKPRPSLHRGVSADGELQVSLFAVDADRWVVQTVELRFPGRPAQMTFPTYEEALGEYDSLVKGDWELINVGD